MSLQHANLIDILAHDKSTDEVIITMVEPRPWDGSDQRLYELQEKLNAYLSFALDGEMLAQLPQLAGKNIRISLDCREEPDSRTAEFIDLVRKQIGFQGIQFTVSVVPDLECETMGGCCGGHGHSHADANSGCCGGHDHPQAETDSGCCGGHGGCGCSE